MTTTELHFIFDAMPGPEGPRLIEVEDQNGHSIKAGEWRTRPDGLVELVVTMPMAHTINFREEGEFGEGATMVVKS